MDKKRIRRDEVEVRVTRPDKKVTRQLLGLIGNYYAITGSNTVDTVDSYSGYYSSYSR